MEKMEKIIGRMEEILVRMERRKFVSKWRKLLYIAGRMGAATLRP